jgi:hypothetical protein
LKSSDENLTFSFDPGLETLEERRLQAISFFSDLGPEIHRRRSHRGSILSSSDLGLETLRRKSLRFSLIIHKPAVLTRLIHKTFGSV